MIDIIRGPVINIVDGDTFDIEVTHIRKENKNKYNDKERIRIEDIDEPELSSPDEKRSKDKLEKKLKGKEVLCFIVNLDSYGQIVADVEIV
jgi:endonuclease YncB( thermonuclease family)